MEVVGNLINFAGICVQRSSVRPHNVATFERGLDPPYLTFPLFHLIACSQH